MDFSADDPSAIPVRLIDEAGSADALSELPDAHKNWAEFSGFRGALAQTCLLPGEAGRPAGVLVGTGDGPARARRRFAVGAAIEGLPPELYRLADTLFGAEGHETALGYLLAQYRFGRYRKARPIGARLVAPDGIDVSHLTEVARGEALTRDLINTPAEDMGPPQLERAASDLGDQFGAKVTVISGDALLTANFPLIHTVGRAAQREPRLIDLHWGSKGPKLTLVGKGVCFDTGGLNLKPSASMGLMKKDMGGAATVLGLARMIMACDLPLQLRVLIPAVENAVSGAAFRPGDIFTSRDGQTVEINNTDAEGRLVLADALALAAEDTPDLLISMATLTGAARVAVGPDIAPFFTTDPMLAQRLRDVATAVADPVWELPFHVPYESMIEPGIADLDNAPKGGFAGAITAALFLRRFTGAHPRYAHFDIYGWQPSAAPARPKGGVGQGARAIMAALPEVLAFD